MKSSFFFPLFFGPRSTEIRILEFWCTGEMAAFSFFAHYKIRRMVLWHKGRGVGVYLATLATVRSLLHDLIGIGQVRGPSCLSLWLWANVGVYAQGTSGSRFESFYISEVKGMFRRVERLPCRSIYFARQALERALAWARWDLFIISVVVVVNDREEYVRLKAFSPWSRARLSQIVQVHSIEWISEK